MAMMRSPDRGRGREPQPRHGRRDRVVLCLALALLGCGSQAAPGGDASSEPEVCPALCEQPPCLLAEHRSYAFRIVADGKSIFWTERALKQPGSVMSLPRTGGTPTTLVAGLADPLYLAVDAQAVYWGSTGLLAGVETGAFSGAVARVGKDGAGPKALVSSVADPQAIALDADRVYFHGLLDRAGSPDVQFGTIHAVPKAGGKVVAVVPEDGGTPLGIAVDATHLYFTNAFPGGIMRAPKGGGEPTMIVGGQSSPWPLALDDRAIFWGNREPLAEGVGPIMTAAKDGTGVRAVVAADPRFSRQVPALALQGDAVYWVESGLQGGRVMKVKKDGTGLTVIAAGPPSANGIATDACFVYWSNLGTDGSIWGAPL
jgi:hypothetical protein